MLAFDVASRTFAYRHFAQVRSPSLSAFSFFIGDFLDRPSKADQRVHYVDVIGIAAKDTTQLCINIETVVECIRKTSLELTILSFWGQTIS